MIVSRMTACAAVAILSSACGGNQACEKPEPYQSSVPGPRIQVPDGLSALSDSAELKIPEASPQPTPPPGSPCLELPPPYTSKAK
jgi:uncharacterized lipoprotein